MKELKEFIKWYREKVKGIYTLTPSIINDLIQKFKA